MLIGLQLVLTIILIGAALKIGAMVSENIEEALGDRPLRDRSGEEI